MMASENSVNSEQSNSCEDSKRPASDDHTDAAGDDKPQAKRPRTTEGGEEILDLAKTLGFKTGDRFEVQWEVGNEGEESTRWWGATLMEHDGRMEDSVAIRTLDYDPYPEGGFPERSQEDVIFLGKDTLVNPETHVELTYRIEGDEGTVWLPRGEVEDVVNQTLMNAMTKNATAWGSLSSSQQALIAGAVASKKDKLVDLLLNHPKGVISSNDMQDILAKTME